MEPQSIVARCTDAAISSSLQLPADQYSCQLSNPGRAKTCYNAYYGDGSQSTEFSYHEKELYVGIDSGIRPAPQPAEGGNTFRSTTTAPTTTEQLNIPPMPGDNRDSVTLNTSEHSFHERSIKNNKSSGGTNIDTKMNLNPGIAKMPTIHQPNKLQLGCAQTGMTQPYMTADKITLQEFPEFSNLYTTIKNENLPNFLGAKITLKSDLRLDNWESLLKDYHNRDVCLFLKYGWPVGYEADITLTSVDKNHQSLIQHSAHVKKFINSELVQRSDRSIPRASFRSMD